MYTLSIYERHTVDETMYIVYYCTANSNPAPSRLNESVCGIVVCLHELY